MMVYAFLAAVFQVQPPRRTSPTPVFLRLIVLQIAAVMVALALVFAANGLAPGAAALMRM